MEIIREMLGDIDYRENLNALQQNIKAILNNKPIKKHSLEDEIQNRIKNEKNFTDFEIINIIRKIINVVSK